MILSSIDSVFLVGAGKMGLALAQGWMDAGLAARALCLIDPDPGAQTQAFAQSAGVALDCRAPENAPRVLVLAVKPQIIGAVMAGLSGVAGPQTLVVSVAAGISIEALEKGLGTARVVRTIPNTPARIGKGISGAVAGTGITASDRDVAGALLAAAGDVVWLDDEGQIDAVTAVSGSGPAYLFHFVEALAAAGVAEGLSEENAMHLARQTVIGAAGLLEADPAPAAALRANVTSPNGTTAAALEVLMAANGLPDLMGRAVKAARRRSRELGG